MEDHTLRVPGRTFDLRQKYYAISKDCNFAPLSSLFYLSLPGILSSSWSHSSQAADAEDAFTGAGHRCLSLPVFCGKKAKSDKFWHPI
jgi:hypothetical protein